MLRRGRPPKSHAHAEATSPSTSTALRHTPDGGGTGVGQVPAAAIGGLRVGDRARGQLHHAEAVLLRAGKHQPTSQVPAAALGGLCAGAWYASTRLMSRDINNEG